METGLKFRVWHIPTKRFVNELQIYWKEGKKNARI
jgi:hypothetical protein